ncbi:MAG: hypothetical protein NC084_02765 [Bacteroides sp.]|nr:hypothetical protein [Eubacterium sp.]MCM1417437.1 hypothetical protein [Roseburia sp.]MCM1461617.1 hypothetical protein [Bacteroides sp.]
MANHAEFIIYFIVYFKVNTFARTPFTNTAALTVALLFREIGAVYSGERAR